MDRRAVGLVNPFTSQAPEPYPEDRQGDDRP